MDIILYIFTGILVLGVVLFVVHVIRVIKILIKDDSEW